MSNWQIGESGTAIVLDDLGRGEVTLTVTNTAPTQDRAVLTVTALDGAAEGWFTIEQPQKAVPPGQSVTYLCKVQVPPETAPAVYACQFVAYSADQDPGETAATSRRVTLEKKVPAQPRKKVPWPLIAAIAAVLLIVIGTVAFLVLKDDGDAELANTEPPTVQGEPQVLQPLAASPGEWSEPDVSFSFAWLRCDEAGENCAAIDGASLPAYAIGLDDVGRTIRVQVTATKGEDRSGKARSEPVGPVTDVGGEPVAVPDVVGLGVAQAATILGENFQVQRLAAGNPVADCNPPVNDQAPNPGTLLERGETVSISAPPISGFILCLDDRVFADQQFLMEQVPGPIPEEQLDGVIDNLAPGL